MNQSRTRSPANWSVKPVIDWLGQSGRLIVDEISFVRALGHQLVDAEAPIDRLTLVTITLNPQVVGSGLYWWRDSDRAVSRRAGHNVLISDRYIGSPLQPVVDDGETLRTRLTELDADAHPSYTELIDDGYTDYFSQPIQLGNGMNCAFIIVTKRTDGFNDHDLDAFCQLRYSLSSLVEVFSLRHTAKSLLDTYVGRRTGQKILDGMIRRGDSEIIHAALWFSDLRDFTHLSETLPPSEVLSTLNDYFEFVSAAVGARGGEVLRFIGDAMLIVFPITDKVTSSEACNSALDSAIDALATLAVTNLLRRRHGKIEIRFGVGLNIGEVIYGNVGAPDRLDFTVMGPAVNRTARLESLTKELGRNILFSGEFADLIEEPVQSLGNHDMKGINQPQAVYALEFE